MASRPEAVAVAANQRTVVSLCAAAADPALQAIDSAGAAGVVWVVRANAPFVGLRVPSGRPPIVGTSGDIIIDDATGEIIEMGMP